ncbi:hypothetical protein R6V09_01570 [Streptomyces sp. W16]|uniref:hypothetical protein n=1 Tax=Streptomyces sp. W16 TaxID=3076631 RepID=UPI00295B4FA6|nr:hypothetical protein [Streptomyces sp. W16]MDV9168834.1 hypothetical protein [Streptomyces sp. W16]
MATKIVVSVKGLIGLDDPARMRGELEAETGLSWRPQEVALADQDAVLSGGIVEIILVAVVSKTAEMTVSAAVDSAKRIVERWRGERLDGLDTSVDTEPGPDSADQDG